MEVNAVCEVSMSGMRNAVATFACKLNKDEI